MPRGNGMGPMGMGQMTGKGAGFCAGYANPGWGCGMGFGRGFRRMHQMAGMPGRAWGRFGYPRSQAGTVPEADERDELNSQVEYLEAQLKHLRSRLNDLDDKG